jgi:arylsulfatase A-like enzyme
MPTNVIYIYADDLGRGMLSCYGQRHFRTPNIDRLAARGVRFENAYGCHVCAPARASLLTGYHDCHAGSWSYTRAGIYDSLFDSADNYGRVRELINNTGFQSRADEVHLAQIAKQAGCVAGQIGKLEWGFATTPEELDRHGWDYHYGYYDHAQCHGFWPPFVFENGARVDIPGNTRRDFGKSYGAADDPEHAAARWDRTGRAAYSQDLYNRKIVEFLTANRDRSFFLYHPSQLPHGPLSVPEIHPGVRDTPGLTDVEKEYASMVLRLDDTVGLIQRTLEELGIADRTMLIFASDNGHAMYYEQQGRCYMRRDLNGRAFDDADYPYTTERSGDVFNGNDSFSGQKLNSLEGGTRIPFIVSGAGVGQPGSTCEHLLANYDVMATLADMWGVPLPGWKDGLSFLSSVLGTAQKQHDHVVFAGREGPALVRPDGWKIRYITSKRKFYLYHLPTDRAEQHDRSDQRPDLVEQLGVALLRACDGNFYHGTAENHKAVRIDEYMDGRGPEDAFPPPQRWQRPSAK